MPSSPSSSPGAAPLHSGKPWQRISVRLALAHSALLVAAISAVLMSTYFVLRLRVEEQDRDSVSLRLGQYSSEYNRFGLPGVLTLASLRKGRAQKAFFVRVADKHNQTLFERDSEDWLEFNPTQLATVIEPPETGTLDWQRLASPSGYHLLLAGTRLPDGTILQVGKATDESNAALQQFRFVGWIILAICVPLSFAGGFFLVARGLRPLRALTRTVKGIEQTAQFSLRTPVRGTGDELDELARVFNRAMARIESLLRTMRESLDNVAHDLRTPMTRLRNRAQHCLESCETVEEYRDALIECVEESDRVLQILDTLMDIAEAEAGITARDVQPIPVVRLMRDVCDLYQEVAEDKEIRMEHQAAEGLLVLGDHLMLRRVLANLVDNALKYSSPGGRVSLTAEPVGEMVAIRVQDTGTGIPPEEHAKIWERLYRGDKSRSERGLGLGLSFVKAIVEAHLGQVSVRSTPGAGSTFGILLPREEPERPAEAETAAAGR